MNSSYITSAMKAEQLPQYELPEIAFVGRSNCGKSTLLNGLLQRKNLARTSRTPGRTQMVNFFGLNDTHIFADLPGYGFSQTSRDSRRHWQGLIEAYLQRHNLAYILFLMDCRRQVEAEDWELLQWVARLHPTIIVFTKSDKLSRSKILQQMADFRKECQQRQLVLADLCSVSSLQPPTIEALRERILGT